MTPTDYEFEATPEDAWDSSDPIPELIRNLVIRCALLDGGPRTGLGDSVTEVLEALKRRVQIRLALRNLTEFDRHRGELILEDLDFVGNRNRARR